MGDETRFKYKLIYASWSESDPTLMKLEEAVTTFLNKGFKLQGAPFIIGHYIYQPMVKDEELADEAPNKINEAK